LRRFEIAGLHRLGEVVEILSERSDLLAVRRRLIGRG
jgi:hypothetical protein